LRERLSIGDAVKRLVDVYQLGRKREFVIEETPHEQPQISTHSRAPAVPGFARACGQLVHELIGRRRPPGREMTVIRGTMVCKTHAAAELANKLQAQGNQAIADPDTPYERTVAAAQKWARLCSNRPAPVRTVFTGVHQVWI